MQLQKFIDIKYCAWLFAGLVLTFTANGTCDDGDSIMHYQFARWAPAHPSLFFEHWAKPLYVFLACPFAQAGMAGIKIFNLLLSGITIILTFYIAAGLKIARKGLVGLILVMSLTRILSWLKKRPLTTPGETKKLPLFLQIANRHFPGITQIGK